MGRTKQRKQNSNNNNNNMSESVEDDNPVLSNSNAVDIEAQLVKQLYQSDEKCKVTGINARTSIGTIKKDHGMYIDLYGHIKKSHGNPPLADFYGTLNCHGREVFQTLPYNSGSFAQFLLPLKCFVIVDTNLANSPNALYWKAHLTLGAKQLSKTTLISTLEHIIEKGDPCFVFELRDASKDLVCFLPTKASLLLHSIKENENSLKNSNLQGDYNVRYQNKLQDFTPSILRTVYSWIRWWFWPIIFLMINYFIFLKPDMILPLIPPLPFASYIGVTINDESLKTIENVLPPVPLTMVNAYQLGMIHGQINTLNTHQACTTSEGVGIGESSQEEKINQLLMKANEYLNTGTKSSSNNIETLTIKQLNMILTELINIENHVSVITRVKGFFNFVNLMWFFAIIGITVSIGPSIYSILKPLHLWLHQVANQIYYKILLPLAKKLHSWYIFEFLSWQFLILLLSTGIKLNIKDIGYMLCITSTFLIFPSFTYTTFLKGKKVETTLLSTLCYIYFILFCYPLAIQFNSIFFGYCVIISIFSVLGFGIWTSSLCYCIGFNSEESLHRVFISSFIILFTFIIVKSMNLVELKYLFPFTSAISIFGTIMLLLSLLIMSTYNYGYNPYKRASTIFTPKGQWIFYNVLMLMVLMLLSFIGHTFGLIGMANTATVFSVLFGLEKYADFHIDQKWNTWVLILMFSLTVWRLSLFLHSRPEFIASMFTGSME